jgi:transcriptional regulator with XRE-family HTH domain
MKDSNSQQITKLRTAGEKMRFIRTNILKLSLEKIANKLGYADKSSISKIEKEDAIASNMRQFYMFCGAYNIPSEIFEKEEINSCIKIENILEKHKPKTEVFTRDEFLEKHLGKWYWYGYANAPELANKKIIVSLCTISFSSQMGYEINIEEIDPHKIDSKIKYDFKGKLTRCDSQINARLFAIEYKEETNMTWIYNNYIDLNDLIFGVKIGYTMRGTAFASKALFSKKKLDDSQAKHLLGEKEIIEIDDRYIKKIN